MFCRHCGAEIPTGSKFCPECGEALIDTAGNCAETVSDNEIGETEEVKPKKPRSKKRNLILIIVLAFLAVVALGLLFGDDDDEYKDKYNDEYENDDDDKEDDHVEEDKKNSEKLTFKTSTNDSSKTSASGKYYPGTEILTLTEVTGVPVSDETLDDNGGVVYTYDATDDYSIIDIVNDYTDELKSNGYKILDPQEVNGQLTLVCRKRNYVVCIGLELDEEAEEKNVYNWCYVLYRTNASASNCDICASEGYDTCQGHTCDVCGGRGNQTCSGCNGTGLARVPTSYSNKCVVCYGQGTQICPNCKGAGKKFYD